MQKQFVAIKQNFRRTNHLQGPLIWTSWNLDCRGGGRVGTVGFRKRVGRGCKPGQIGRWLLAWAHAFSGVACSSSIVHNSATCLPLILPKKPTESHVPNWTSPKEILSVFKHLLSGSVRVGFAFVTTHVQSLWRDWNMTLVRTILFWNSAIGSLYYDTKAGLS